MREKGGKRVDILIVMCLGIAAGKYLFPRRAAKANERLQLLCTLLLIFSMGVMLGRREDFFRELSSLGLTSLLFCLVPTALSVLAVYRLSRRFLERREEGAGEKEKAKEARK